MSKSASRTDTAKKSGNDLTAEALKLLARRDDPRADPNPYYHAGRQISEGLVGWSSSIDGYLNRHQDQELVQQCGKLAIAQVILESENGCDMYVDLSAPHKLSFRDAAKVRHSWFQQLWSILEAGIIRSKNLESIFDKLNVITFNYDRTLENFLFMGMQQAYHLPEKDAAAIINAKLDIDHVYGQVADLPWQNKGHGLAFGRKPDACDLVPLWNRITTFNEEISDAQILTKLANKVSNAERIVFLGCHFHEQNMKLLRAALPARGGDVSIYATALQRSSSALMEIDSQIREMLAPRGGGWHVHIDSRWDCKELFREFDTTWSRK
ncbi:MULTISPECIES: hypothetical protein [unclassified Bradyrhizobium]|uniref:hypothetical protein n=1 Tax=unclassified Bradyrhizobium TaxID=2631580 RepID=UPI001FFB8B9D|nr:MULTISPECIES: hypothetical protein [unclassified Bradyrhizobium]MCK1716015.1 hypothetical protein [Bradyrhizobium sp. 143]MCK1728038.1 hypothetical protein [Bradyrhizobium sp. 142]